MGVARICSKLVSEGFEKVNLLVLFLQSSVTPGKHEKGPFGGPSNCELDNFLNIPMFDCEN